MQDWGQLMIYELMVRHGGYREAQLIFAPRYCALPWSSEC